MSKMSIDAYMNSGYSRIQAIKLCYEDAVKNDNQRASLQRGIEVSYSYSNLYSAC
jgi:hypothetical protein